MGGMVTDEKEEMIGGGLCKMRIWKACAYGLAFGIWCMVWAFCM